MCKINCSGGCIECAPEEHPPTHETFIKALEDSLKYCQEADDAGSIDREMGRWQEWVANYWPPIFDKNGGI